MAVICSTLHSHSSLFVKLYCNVLCHFDMHNASLDVCVCPTLLCTVYFALCCAQCALSHFAMYTISLFYEAALQCCLPLWLRLQIIGTINSKNPAFETARFQFSLITKWNNEITLQDQAVLAFSFPSAPAALLHCLLASCNNHKHMDPNYNPQSKYQNYNTCL